MCVMMTIFETQRSDYSVNMYDKPNFSDCLRASLKNHLFLTFEKSSRPAAGEVERKTCAILLCNVIVHYR